MRPPIYVMGDVHGYLDRLLYLLGKEGLLNNRLHWAGDNSTLVFTGDYFDRGADGVGVIDLIMRLQKEAAEAGGEVLALLGNHELSILSAYSFLHNEFPYNTWSAELNSTWERNGGQQSDLEHLTPAHVSWLSALPAMLIVDERRFVHADSLVYYNYGKTAPDVNKAFRALIRARDPEAWATLLKDFVKRGAFVDSNPSGKENALHFLAQYNGYGIIHGHTPIAKVTGQRYEDVIGPLVYAGGLCTNVDGGIYKGGPGFIYRLPVL